MFNLGQLTFSSFKIKRKHEGLKIVLKTQKLNILTEKKQQNVCM